MLAFCHNRHTSSAQSNRSREKMEFKKILTYLIKNFEEKNIRYGLIGGFSLIVLGIPRTTVDLDFLVHTEDLEKLDGVMKALGYKLVFRTKNVSQYVSSIKTLGEVDVVHAKRKYSKRMLAQAQMKKFEDLTIKVLGPEDIVGLKVQAIANDPTRKTRELADIESILDKFRKEVNWKLLKEYFQLFDLDEDYKKIVKRYERID